MQDSSEVQERTKGLISRSFTSFRQNQLDYSRKRVVSGAIIILVTARRLRS